MNAALLILNLILLVVVIGNVDDVFRKVLALDHMKGLRDETARLSQIVASIPVDIRVAFCGGLPDVYAFASANLGEYPYTASGGKGSDPNLRATVGNEVMAQLGLELCDQRRGIRAEDQTQVTIAPVKVDVRALGKALKKAKPKRAKRGRVKV